MKETIDSHWRRTHDFSTMLLRCSKKIIKIKAGCTDAAAAGGAFPEFVMAKEVLLSFLSQEFRQQPPGLRCLSTLMMWQPYFPSHVGSSVFIKISMSMAARRILNEHIYRMDR